MRIKDMNWMQVEKYLQEDDRAILPIGSTEQHAYLSLMVDCILAERVAAEAAEPLGVPVFPPLNYGVAPYFKKFPGTVSLRMITLLKMVEDVLDCMAEQGFRRILIVNGHGGNSFVQGFVQEWMNCHPGIRVKFHNWWSAPRTLAKVKEIDPLASHASWMENFQWTRLSGIEMPDRQKPMIDLEELRHSSATEARVRIGDGNYGGYYQRSDLDMKALWGIAVQETRELIETRW